MSAFGRKAAWVQGRWMSICDPKRTSAHISSCNSEKLRLALSKHSLEAHDAVSRAGVCMRRRDFIAAAGSAAVAWPSCAPAQTTMPTIGFLDGRTSDAMTSRLSGLHRGLKETGFVESENVSIVYRWAENKGDDRLPALAAELVRRPVAVLVSSGGLGVAFALKAATTTIPVIFLSSEDPVRLGLVASLARPGGNLTGINFLSREL